MRIPRIHTLQQLNLSMTFWLFNLLLWGYILFNFLLLFNVIPSYFGGYFGVVSAIAFIYYLFFSDEIIKYNLQASRFFTFVSLSAFLIAITYTLVSSIYIELRPAVIQSIEMIVFWGAFYGLGFYFILIDKDKILKISKILTILFLAYTLTYIITTGSTMLAFGTYEIDNKNITGYQSLARNILITSVIIIAYTSKRITQILYMIICSITLFLIGARSEFYAFILAILVYQAVLATKIKSSFVLLATTISLAVLLIIYNIELIKSSRQFNVTNLGGDESWGLRQGLTQYALKTINQHPILGDFGSHVFQTPNHIVGGYSHNLLSAYTNYGLVFFILFLIMIYITPIYSGYKFFKNVYNQDWAFSFMITVFVAFLATTSKSVFWLVTYFGWGVFMGALYKSKINKPKRLD